MLRRAWMLIVLAVMPIVPAQAGQIIFDNLSQANTPSSPMVGPDSWLAQKFIPQTNATLDTVILRMSGTPMSEGLPVAELYSDDGAWPGISLGVLISPAEAPPWSATNVAFGGNNLPLTAGVSYWIVLKTEWYAWRATTVTNCDAATCGPAFSPDSAHTIESGGWSSDTWVLKMQVDVNEATAVPEPAALWLALPLAGLPLRLRRKSAR